MKRTLLLSLLALLLSGCTTIAIPADAIRDVHPDVPDAEMWAWVETSGNFSTIHAVFYHNGTELVRVNSVQPNGFWNLTILDTDGSEVLYDDRPGRKDWDELLHAPFHEEFRFTWLHNEYERYQLAGTHEAIPDHQVPSGEYTAVLAFRLFDAPEGAFQVNIPIVVS